MPDVYIFAEDKTGRGGGGPEDDPRHSAKAIRTNGLSVFAFAIALALVFAMFFGVFEAYLHPEIDESASTLDGFLKLIASVEPEEWYAYILYGFFMGAAIAGIYNLLVVRRINIFGMESSAD